MVNDLSKLRSRVYKYFTYKQTYNYIDNLQNTVSSSNNTYHGSIKMTPSEVTRENQEQSWITQYAEPLLRQRKRQIKVKYRVDALVDREYSERWTGELFRIVGVLTKNRIPMYKLQDYMGESVDGYFQELQAAVIDQPYKISKILRTRKTDGRKQYFVSWLHWPEKYNSWISESEMVDL